MDFEGIAQKRFLKKADRCSLFQSYLVLMVRVEAGAIHVLQEGNAPKIKKNARRKFQVCFCGHLLY